MRFNRRFDAKSLLLLGVAFALSGCGFKIGIDREAILALYQNRGGTATTTLTPTATASAIPVPPVVPGTPGTIDTTTPGSGSASGPDGYDYDDDRGYGRPDYGSGYGSGYGYGSGDMPWQQKGSVPISSYPDYGKQNKKTPSYPGGSPDRGYGGDYGGDSGYGYGDQARGGSGYGSHRSRSGMRSRATPGEAGIQLGEGCQQRSEGDDRFYCLGLKYVVYRDPRSGMPLELPADVLRNIEDVNRIWEECGIGFQVESYVAADTGLYGVSYRTSDYDELNSIRRRFGEEERLLIVLTGEWNRRGTLGETPANAWTNMPGDGIYGAILEGPMRRSSNLIAHELGHYLGLDHVDDWASLMNPVVAPNSRRLEREQCRLARKVIRREWASALRSHTDP